MPDDLPLRDAAQALLDALPDPSTEREAVCPACGSALGHIGGCVAEVLRAALAAADTAPTVAHVELIDGVIFDGPPPAAIDIDHATIAPPDDGTTPTQPDEVLWEGPVGGASYTTEGFRSHLRVPLPVPPGTRVRVVATPATETTP